MGALPGRSRRDRRGQPGRAALSARRPSPGDEPQPGPHWATPHLCALLASASLLPGVAGSISVALYLGRTAGWSGSTCWVVGAAAAVGAWLALAPLLRRYAYPDRANPSVYDELRAEYDDLQARWEQLPDDGRTGAPAAGTHLAAAARELGLADPAARPAASLRWTLATGYVAAWKRLHRAEEELLGASPTPVVVETALENRTRLQGSRIANAPALVRELELAIERLEPQAVAYLDADRPPRASAAAPAHAPAAVPAPAVPADDGTARLVVRRIARSIHEYRDSRRAGLVRSRNRLFATVVFAGVTTYAVLGLALVTGADRAAVAAGAAYYLIGGVIGLFQQLRAASAADTVTEEDYGLSIARLIHTPLFSGIAAVAGVALAVLAPLVNPGPGQAGAASLSAVFNLAHYPAGVVVAAVFGLTPSLLITRLQQQAEQYKADLRGSEAAEQHGGTPAAAA